MVPRTSAVMASTIGTARGSTHGSWRPRPFERGVVQLRVHGVLLVHHGGNRRSHAEVDRFPVGDASLDASAAVGHGADTPPRCGRHRCAGRPVRLTPANPLPDLKPLVAGNDSIALGRPPTGREHRGSPSDRDAAGDARDDAADAVAFGAPARCAQSSVPPSRRRDTGRCWIPPRTP